MAPVFGSLYDEYYASARVDSQAEDVPHSSNGFLILVLYTHRDSFDIHQTNRLLLTKEFQNISPASICRKINSRTILGEMEVSRSIPVLVTNGISGCGTFGML